MEYVQGNIRLSATDVANHLSCKHLTTLNLLLAKGALAAPDWANPDLKVLQQLGLDHEKAYVDNLRTTGLSVVDVSQEANSRDATLDAMKKGIQVIVQANLASGEWLGRADVLLRVEQPSALGDWSYQAVDCKLSRTTKAETILQLCFYSELLTDVQGREPESFHVIRPHTNYEPESHRVSQYAAYYRYVKRAVKHAVDNANGKTYPEVVPHCDICRWWKHCDQQLRKDDSLSFVHGISRLQRKELAIHSVGTLKGLATLPIPLPFKPSKGGVEGYRRIREQARIQLEARTANQPKWEKLPLEKGRGLFRLPAPSPGDLFFDFEGDPFTGENGLEYLFGLLGEEAGKLVYQSHWASDFTSEKQAFEWFIDLVIKRLSQFGDLHIYHFGSYEPSAIKRLVLRYATREQEVDRLLRGGVFVDLNKVFKEAILAGVEQYSLKDLEQFCGYKRNVQLPDARTALHTIQHLLQLGLAADITDKTRQVVAAYNEDDCRSTKQLRDWLEGVRKSIVDGGQPIDRPASVDGAPSDKGAAQYKRVTDLFEALTRDVPVDPKDRNQQQAALWLLAYSLDWHRRENKVKWWEFFHLADADEDDLYLERTAIAGMGYVGRLPKSSPREKAPTDQYKFPPQECSIREGDALYTQDGNDFGEVISIDPLAGTVVVKKRIKVDALHPTCVFTHVDFPTKEQSESILRLAESILKNGIDHHGEYRAARDLVLRNSPRLAQGTIPTTDITIQSICDAGLALDRSMLPIQGPPGSGKTYTAAHMICALVKAEKRVGITAVGHKVIRKLLDDVVAVSRENKVAGVTCAHRNTTSSTGGAVSEFDDNGAALQALQTGTIKVLGATSFVWSRQDFVNSVDVLFVDEAGQMALANVLACSPAASSLVLLGDPQQLEQPTQGSHPEGSDVSALAHVLGGRKTIDPSQGIFLSNTRRLHPELCKFTSEMFYESRLVSHAGLENQKVNVSEPFSGAGLWLITVKHSGNQSHSQEEIEVVVPLFKFLTKAGNTWTDANGKQHPLSADRVLIVTPFNDQVNRLSQRLPNAQVGTVDRFQGQEGTVVIYSMAASSVEDAPRGMEFLYDLNRFNVATSRARCSCIVVASPVLFEPDCRTPKQIELANALCRYVEMGKTVKG
jgi:predicted RecB family nuclease